MPQQKFIVQVTTLPDCDDITRFGTRIRTFWVSSSVSDPDSIRSVDPVPGGQKLHTKIEKS
jgi:hypothetical protein